MFQYTCENSSFINQIKLNGPFITLYITADNKTLFTAFRTYLEEKYKLFDDNTILHDLAHGEHNATAQSSSAILETDRMKAHLHVFLSQYPTHIDLERILKCIKKHNKNYISDSNVENVIKEFNSFITKPSMALLHHIYDRFIFGLGAISMSNLLLKKIYIDLCNIEEKVKIEQEIKIEKNISNSDLSLSVHLELFKDFAQLITSLQCKFDDKQLEKLKGFIKAGLAYKDVSFGEAFELSEQEVIGMFQFLSFHHLYNAFHFIVNNFKIGTAFSKGLTDPDMIHSLKPANSNQSKENTSLISSLHLGSKFKSNSASSLFSTGPSSTPIKEAVTFSTPQMKHSVKKEEPKVAVIEWPSKKELEKKKDVEKPTNPSVALIGQFGGTPGKLPVNKNIKIIQPKTYTSEKRQSPGPFNS